MALIADQKAGDRRVVVHQQPAFAVEDLSARGKNGNLADAVGLRKSMVVLSADYLEPPKPEDQHQHYGDDGVLESAYLDGRYVLGLAFEFGEKITHSIHRRSYAAARRVRQGQWPGGPL